MKRTKRKHILFSEEQWETVCQRADRLDMKTTAYIRNMALYREYKYMSGDHVFFPMNTINRIGVDLRTILGAAEKTNSSHTEKLRELYGRYEIGRMRCNEYFSQFLNRFD